jgi:heme-degrading monooxygenase HmoA
MLRMEPLDPQVPIMAQLGGDATPVVLVNMFSVDPKDADTLMTAWEHDANWMKQQPGYISTQLHRAVGPSAMFMNYAIWESIAHFRAAFSHPDFRSALAEYPDTAVAQPHLFERIAVPNLCTI